MRRTIMVLVLGLLQLDAFMKRLVHTHTKRHIALFSWEEEALKGLVTLGTLVIYVSVSDKRISDAAAASDKRFSDLISSHSTIRSADKDTLNAIVQELSTELKASNDRTSAEVEEIKAEVKKMMEASNERTIAEVKENQVSNERAMVNLGELVKQSLQRKGFFGY